MNGFTEANMIFYCNNHLYGIPAIIRLFDAMIEKKKRKKTEELNAN